MMSEPKPECENYGKKCVLSQEKDQQDADRVDCEICAAVHEPACLHDAILSATKSRAALSAATTSA